MSSRFPAQVVETATRFAIDLKDFPKALQKCDRLCGDANFTGSGSPLAAGGGPVAGASLRPMPQPATSAEERAAVDAVRQALVADAKVQTGEASKAHMATLMAYLQPVRSQVKEEGAAEAASETSAATTGADATPGAVSAKAFADALSEMCFLGETYFLKSYRHLECPFAENLATAVVHALSSPSRVLRLLGITCSRMFAAVPKFYRAWWNAKGHAWLGMCLDRELSQEMEYAFGFILRLTDLQLKESVTLEPPLPQGLANRIATLLDPSDSLSTLTPSIKQRAIYLALQVLEAFPTQAAAADLVRILLCVCTVSGTTADEIQSILRGVLAMYDNPHRRPFLRDSDLTALIVPFVDSSAQDDDDEHIRRLQQAGIAILKLMTTWSGLLWVSSETMCLRALVDVLHLPGPVARKMILLHTFNAMLRSVAPHRGIPAPPPWSPAGKRVRAATQGAGDFELVDTDDIAQESQGFAMYLEGDEMEEDDMIPTTKAIGYHAADPLCATLLLALEHHGLPLALIAVAKRSGSAGYTPEIAHEAAMLLQHLLDLMDHLLPASTVSTLHGSFTQAIASLYRENHLLVGTLTSKLLENLHLTPSLPNSREDTSALSTPWLMDDAAFQLNLKESHVEQHNEAGRWNYDVLLLLLQGPLRNPQRIRWVRDNTRFFTRVVGFYKPSSVKSFATLRREEVTSQICGLGVAMVETLLATKEGSEILERAEFPKGFRFMLQEVINWGTDASCPQPTILQWERLGPGAPPIGHTFFLMLGRFTRFANGLNMLKKGGVLDTMRELLLTLTKRSATGGTIVGGGSASGGGAGNGSSNNSSISSGGGGSGDILFETCHQLLQQLYLGSVPNYGVTEEVRHMVRISMDNQRCNPIRLCALTQLRRVLWRDLSSSMEWGIARLVESLKDPFFTIVEHSFRMLASICCSSLHALEFLISLKPLALVHTPMIRENRKKWGGTTLLYRMLGRERGFQILQSAGWIDEELTLWQNTESQAYAEEVERLSQGRDLLSSSSGGGVVGFSFSSRGGGGGPLSDSDSSFGGGAGGGAGTVRRTNSNSVGRRQRGVSFAISSSSIHHFPVHVLSELCRTSAGCDMIRSHRMFTDAVADVLSLSSSNCVPVQSPQALHMDATVSWGPVMPDMYASTPDKPRRAGGARQPNAEDIAVEVDEMSFYQNRNSTFVQQMESSSQDGMADADADVLISASRGYERKHIDCTLDCGSGSSTSGGGPAAIARLKRSVLLLCSVGSSTTGFELLMSASGVGGGGPRGEVVERLLDLAHYANHLSLRGMAMVGVSILSRCPSAAAFLVEHRFAYVHTPDAYTSASGLPYSVAYGHPTDTEWMCVRPPPAHRGHAPRNAYKEGSAEARPLNKEIADSILALPNPVSRDGAKVKLHSVFKDAPKTFCDDTTQRLLVDVGSMFRLRSTERKFIVELLQRSQTSPSTQ